MPALGRGYANKHLQTDDLAIYAIGDVVGEPMLAHKASHEGRTAVEHVAGRKVAFEPNAIPAVSSRLITSRTFIS